MKPLALMLGLFGAAILPHECSAQILDNPFSEYIQRDIRMTPDGGNANDANAAIHTIDPWPPYARHTRIPGNGRESVGAVHQMYTILIRSAARVAAARVAAARARVLL